MDPGFAPTPENAPREDAPARPEPAQPNAHRQGDEALRIIEDLEGRLARLRAIEAEQDEQQETLKRQLEDVEQQRADLEAQRESLHTRERELASERAALQQRSSEIASQSDQLRQQAHAIEADQRASASRASDLEERESAVKARARAIEAAALELEARAADLDARQARLSEEAERVDDEERARLTETLAAAERSVDALTQRVSALERERQTLCDQLSSAQRAQQNQRQQLKIRQRRLRAVRAALQARAERLLKARDALRAKARECDAIVKERDKQQEEIAREQRALASQRKRLHQRLRKRDAGVLFATLAIGLAALGAIAWSIATRVAPATYVAHATLAPAAGVDVDAPAPDAGVDAWRQGVLAILEDPRLADVATDRLRRRGVLEFASPAELSGALRERLSADALAPDRVRLAFVGQGAERTRLVLDTILASLVSMANDARRLGAAGLSTMVAREPNAVAAVKDDRLMYAGAFLAGGALPLAFLAWLLASRARRVAAAMDDDAGA